MDASEQAGHGPVKLEALIPGFQERLARMMELADEHNSSRPEATIELTTEQAVSRVLPVVPAIMENNLSRKGVWATDPNRSVLEYRYQTEDLIGSLTVEYSLGQLSTFEMELVAWILGRWQPQAPKVTFSLRECSREFGTSWSGQRGEFLKEALRRIDRTRFTGRVWDASTKKFTTKHFGIFDVVEIVERKESFDAPSLEPGTVAVTLSSFLSEQLIAQQFVRLNWQVLRGALHSPLGRRLYVFLESQRGFKDGTSYDITIDNQLMETLGSKDKSNPRRFRAKLLRAGDEIVAADGRYQTITIRVGQQRNSYILQVRRRAA
jgi:Initiator Replication protein